MNVYFFIIKFLIMKKYLMVSFLILLSAISCKQKNDQNEKQESPLEVEIKEDNDRFQMFVNDKPYFVKGARTLRTRYMEET